MLQITLVMEDKISLDDLQEEIAEFEDYVQSTDVAGMSPLHTLLVLKLTSFSYAKALEERSRSILYGIRRRMHICYNATFGSCRPQLEQLSFHPIHTIFAKSQ